MDGLKHPVGEQTPNVYWRRRVSVIVVIVLVGLLAWWAIGALTRDSANPGASTTPNPTVSTSPGSTTSADPNRACTKTDFTVASGPKVGVFTATDLPTFTVTVTSVADTACIVDPTKDSKIVITSGDEKWFDSSTCADYSVFDTEKFFLEPGGKKALTAAWNLGRDKAGCPSDEDPAAVKGFYWFTATVQGVAAERLQFEVR